MAVSAPEILREMSARSLLLFDPRRQLRAGADSIRAQLLTTSSELQATATVLVMLDLIAEAEAEQILVDHKRALEMLSVHPHGVQYGELTLRPTSAYGFQAARRRPMVSLSQRPARVAAPGARAILSDCEVLVEWLVVAPSGVRGRAVITTSVDGGLPAGQLEVVIPCVDDTGSTHALWARAGQRGVIVTPPPHTGVAATTTWISVEPPVSVAAEWIELRPPKGPPVRIDLVELIATRPCGRSELEWPTQAEWFLDALLPEADTTPGATFGVGLDTAGALQVAGAVADALLAIGALPASSPLLSGQLRHDHRWQNELTTRYRTRAHQAFASASQPRRVAAVGATVPLAYSVGVFEAIVVQDRDVWMHLYFFPDTQGEYWPASIRPWRVTASDDLGHQHHTVPATYWALPDHEGSGDLWLWPPLDPSASTLRLTVSTPWEAAWTEVPLLPD
ncbi:MAG: hypothetical protein ABSG36_11475 [Acidimicrobiales bacterium]